MKNFIFGFSILAIIMHFTPAAARAGEPALADNAHPISGLIADWQRFRAGILAKTRKFDPDDVIRADHLSSLPESLIGNWKLDKHQTSGYVLHTVLQLKRDHRFHYHYQVKAGSVEDKWGFSGRWEVRNQILMLLIDKSNYPGKAAHQVLFWRLLKLDKSKLVYVRAGSGTLSSMTRVSQAG